MKSFKASKTVWVTVSILVAIIGVQTWIISAKDNINPVTDHDKTIPVTVQNDAAGDSETAESNDPLQLWSDDDLFRKDPFEEMERMHDHMRKMMDLAMADFDKDSWLGSTSGNANRPEVLLEDEGDSYRISIRIPGEDQPQVKTELSGNKMFINSLQDQTSENKNENTGSYSRSFRKQSYSQVIQFPEAVDPKSLESQFEDKALILRLKKLRD